jgi:CheY-like chemotaxis protein
MARSGSSILVVDDDKGFRNFLSTVLEPGGLLDG